MSHPVAAGKLSLLAPVSGPMVPIEQVPDPVFAQKMVGDGISIDPTKREPGCSPFGPVMPAYPSLSLVSPTTGASSLAPP